MAITQTWKVTGMKFYQNLEGMDRVVSEVTWQIVTAMPGQPDQTSQGVTRFSPPTLENFVPYESLNEAMIIGWVQTVIGAARVLEYQTKGYDFMARNVTTEETVDVFPWA